MGHRKRLLSLIAGVALVGALPSIAVANTTEAIAQTGGMTLTLPGASLALGITLDEFGNIDTVSIDPAGAVSPDHASDHKVTFKRAGDGSTVVKVKAGGQKLTAKIKTSNLSQLTGDQTWSAVVFELPGDASVVKFKIVQRTSADGKTYLAIAELDASDTPHDKSVIDPTTKSESHDDDDDDDEWEYESKAGVDYFRDGYTKSLRIEVETEYEDDDEHEGVRAKLKIELRGKDVQKLVGEAAVVGPHTWTGLLCDGTTATVQYNVGELGNVTIAQDDISADGYTWTVDSDDDGFKVEFDSLTNDEDDGAYVKVEVENEHGELELKVSSRTTASCDDDDDHDDDHDGEGHRDDDDEDDDDEDHDGDKVKDDDDEDHSGSDSRDDDDDDDDEDDD